MRTRPFLAATCLALGVSLTGCGSAGVGGPAAEPAPRTATGTDTDIDIQTQTQTQTEPETRPGEAGPPPPHRPDPDGGPCPAAFTDVAEARSTTGTTSADQFAHPGRWWTCVYQAGRIAERGWWIQWRRTEPPRRTDAAAADLLGRLAGSGTPAAPDRTCTADLGPRLAAVHTGAPEHSRPALVLDLFGCRDLRLLPGLDGVRLSGDDPVLQPGLDRAGWRRLRALAR